MPDEKILVFLFVDVAWAEGIFVVQAFIKTESIANEKHLN